MPRDHFGREYIQVGPVRIYVGTDAECEEAQIAVCSPVGSFPDDVHTTCATCGTAIVHRPYLSSRPPKVCPDCAIWIIRAGGRRA